MCLTQFTQAVFVSSLNQHFRSWILWRRCFLCLQSFRKFIIVKCLFQTTIPQTTNRMSDNICGNISHAFSRSKVLMLKYPMFPEIVKNSFFISSLHCHHHSTVPLYFITILCYVMLTAVKICCLLHMFFLFGCLGAKCSFLFCLWEQ